jgi:hypothetical protein
VAASRSCADASGPTTTSGWYLCRQKDIVRKNVIFVV